MLKTQSLIFFFLSFTIVVIFFISMKSSSPEESNWAAPSDADKLTNPLNKDKDAWKKAEETYNTLCAICHGENGLGDGIAGMALNPRPANFTLDRVQKQSDGAIFWKLTNGKPPMAPYKEALTEEQRWQLVNYIRHLVKK